MHSYNVNMTTIDLVIRKALKTDQDQLLTLKSVENDRQYELYKKYVTKRVNDLNNADALFLVGEINNEIVAQLLIVFIGIERHPEYPFLEDLHVKESYRNIGIGSRMMQEAERIIKSRGYNKVGLSVNPSLNAPALRLYTRLGYTMTSDTLYLDGIYDGSKDLVVDMEKPL